MIKNTCKILFLASLLLLPSLSARFALGQETFDQKSRSFGFHYGATIEDIPAGADVTVWIPVSETNNEQDVEIVETSSPSPLGFHRDDTYQNRMAFLQLKSTGQPVSFSIDYLVNRREAALNGAAEKLTAAEAELFLKANSMVPVSGVPLSLLDKRKISSEPLAAGQALYEVVESFMKYDKSKPGYGKGDVLWACDSRTGNCTDFHSLFISLARSRSIPAKFEIGFPIGSAEKGKVNGYHCWAWFFAEGRGWMPVDISEADKRPELKDYYFGHLSEDRIAFTTGRDIKLTPASKSEPLNFFIYPHVEVDGKVWPLSRIKLSFSYQNRNTEQN